MTPEIIDSAITITDIELCAMWTPLSIVCGPSWFLDDTVRSKMVSFVPLMRKQSFWIISRFVRALILMNELEEDLSVDTRQDIFLYSSKIGILPGFPTPNGGWPSCTGEWMALAPYFGDAMVTNEMKTFMRRYGYKTKGMVAEELRKAKELEEKRVAEAEERYRLDEERKSREIETVAQQLEAPYVVAVGDESEINEVEIAQRTTDNGQNDIMFGVGGADVLAGKLAEEVQDLIMSGVAVEGTQKETKVEAEVVVEQPKEVKEEIVEDEKAGGPSDSTTEYMDFSTCDSEDSGADEIDSEDDFMQGRKPDWEKRDFATSMRVVASNKMTEEHATSGKTDDVLFKDRLEDIRKTLQLAGVRRWMDTNLHLILLAGPVGISRWSMELLKAVQAELKAATVKIKDLNASVIQTMADIEKERAQTLKADVIWDNAQKELRDNMDQVSGMQKQDLNRREAVAVSGGLFSGGQPSSSGGQPSSSGKRRSVYAIEERKKKKPKAKNPFERGTSSRSDTL